MEDKERRIVWCCVLIILGLMPIYSHISLWWLIVGLPLAVIGAKNLGKIFNEDE